jgi:hypothetical protein
MYGIPNTNVMLAANAVLAALLAGSMPLGGCVSREPPRPAMVAQSVAGDYGYSETQLAPDRFRISYVTPVLRIGSSVDRASVLERERTRAYDLALLRASQVALANRFPAFEIEMDGRDAELAVRRDRSYPAWPYPCFRVAIVGGTGIPTAGITRATARGHRSESRSIWSFGCVGNRLRAPSTPHRPSSACA